MKRINFKSRIAILYLTSLLYFHSQAFTINGKLVVFHYFKVQNIEISNTMGYISLKKLVSGSQHSLDVLTLLAGTQYSEAKAAGMVGAFMGQGVMPIVLLQMFQATTWSM